MEKKKARSRKYMIESKQRKVEEERAGGRKTKGKRVFFYKQKTAYGMCGRDWSSDVCSSDLHRMRRFEIPVKAAQDAAMFVTVNLALPDHNRGFRAMHERGLGAAVGPIGRVCGHQIGRASCRERV